MSYKEQTIDTGIIRQFLFSIIIFIQKDFFYMVFIATIVTHFFDRSHLNQVILITLTSHTRRSLYILIELDDLLIFQITLVMYTPSSDFLLHFT